MTNNLGTLSYKLQINFGVLQIDPENSVTGPVIIKGFTRGQTIPPFSHKYFLNFGKVQNMHF